MLNPQKYFQQPGVKSAERFITRPDAVFLKDSFMREMLSLLARSPQFAETEYQYFSDHYLSQHCNVEVSATVTEKEVPHEPVIAEPLALTALSRERWVRQTLSRILKENPTTQQVLSLGAGLNPLSERKAKYPVQFFEVDKPGIVSLKCALYQGMSHVSHTQFVEGDYLLPETWKKLKAQGLDAAKPTIVIFFGNTYYLTKPQIDQVLGYCREHLKSFHLLLDYAFAEALDPESAARLDETFGKGQNYLSETAQHMKDIGAEWRPGFDPHLLGSYFQENHAMHSFKILQQQGI